MAKATEKRIFLTRHAQAEHNVHQDYSIPDARLTPLGRRQSAHLHEKTKDTIQQSAELLVTSAMRRPLSTTLVGYATLKKRLESEGKPIVILPQLQECNDFPCDIGSPREELESDPEYAGLDFSLLAPGPAYDGLDFGILPSNWDWRSKQGFYAPNLDALHSRARWNRLWLRARPEREIVVVAHHDCLWHLTESPKYDTSSWANAEVREYTFDVDEEDDKDGNAYLRPLKSRSVAKEGDEAPSSSEMITY